MIAKLRRSRLTLTLRRSALSVALALTVVAGTLVVAEPASAATWKLVWRKTSCHTYSFGRLCTVKSRYFRSSSAYCRSYNPDPTDWYLAVLTSLSMYQYCYKYTERSYYA